MKLPMLAVALLSVGMLCGCWTSNKRETVTLLPFKDTFAWRAYHLSQAEPESADGHFRFISVSRVGDVTLRDLSSGQSISIRHDQPRDEMATSKMPMRVTRFDFQNQAADFEWLTTK